jgi:hypothetical protein
LKYGFQLDKDMKIDCGLCYHFYATEATVSLVAGKKRGRSITGRAARC